MVKKGDDDEEEDEIEEDMDEARSMGDTDRLEQAMLEREFLVKELSRAVGLGGMDGTDLIHQLGNLQGSLPFTVMVDAKGRIAQRKSDC